MTLSHAEFSRKGGQSRSEAKQRASRENAKKALEARIKKQYEIKNQTTKDQQDLA